MNSIVNKKVFSVTLALVLTVSVSLYLFGSREEASRACRLLQESSSYPAASSVNINRSLSGETEHASGEEEGRETEDNFLYLLSRVDSFSSNLNMALLIGFILLSVFYLGSAFGKKRAVSFYSRLQHYSNWRLKFLTPLQKVILNRSGEYDITRIREIFREKSPHFVFEQNAGFFYRP